MAHFDSNIDTYVCKCVLTDFLHTCLSSFRVTMPRAVASGDARKAKRLKVLALKDAEPSLGATVIGRRLRPP